MPPSRKHRILAAISVGMIVGGALTATHAHAEATTARPNCPAREALVPGEDNYIVGNPDIFQVGDRVISWSEYRNPGGAAAPPGFKLAVQSAGFCRYNYEIWGNSSLGSPFYMSSEFFRTVRPYG